MKKFTSIDSALYQPLELRLMNEIRGGRMASGEGCTYKECKSQTEDPLSCNGDTRTDTTYDEGGSSSSTERNPCNPVNPV